METIQTDQDVDQLVWSIIADSRNPHDFVAYCRHAVDRDAGHDLAMRQAQRYWFDEPAPALFPKAVALLESLAEQGNTAAMFHLARWYRMGYGVEINSQLGLDWYRSGMEAGDVRCLVNMARNTSLTDPQAAALMFQQAIDQGYPNAHCFWAEADKENKEQHLRLAA
jgi:TPR repeat protein